MCTGIWALIYFIQIENPHVRFKYYAHATSHTKLYTSRAIRSACFVYKYICIYVRRNILNYIIGVKCLLMMRGIRCGAVQNWVVFGLYSNVCVCVCARSVHFLYAHKNHNSRLMVLESFWHLEKLACVCV